MFTTRKKQNKTTLSPMGISLQLRNPSSSAMHYHIGGVTFTPALHYFSCRNIRSFSLSLHRARKLTERLIFLY